MKTPRFPWYEPQAKEHYINQQIDKLVMALLAHGAQFYLYRNLEVMYLNGQVIDLFRKSAVLAFLKKINLLPEAYAREVVELFRTSIDARYKVIPVTAIGTVNGIKQPRPRMAPYLGSAEAHWLQQVIESGKLSQS